MGLNIATVRILEPFRGVQKVFYFPCFGIRNASFKGIYTLNGVFFNTESLNARAIYFKLIYGSDMDMYLYNAYIYTYILIQPFFRVLRPKTSNFTRHKFLDLVTYQFFKDNEIYVNIPNFCPPVYQINCSGKSLSVRHNIIMFSNQSNVQRAAHAHDDAPR